MEAVVAMLVLSIVAAAGMAALSAGTSAARQSSVRTARAMELESALLATISADSLLVGCATSGVVNVSQPQVRITCRADERHPGLVEVSAHDTIAARAVVTIARLPL